MVAIGKREIQLDVLRGTAIVLAMGWHLNGNLAQPTVTNLWQAPGRFFGWAGVDLFFVLSGFLVGGLVLREVDETRNFNYLKFLLRRAFRLWPVLYLYLIAQMVLSDRPFQTYLPQILLHVQNFFETPFDHLWSLAVEEQFYLIVALSIPIMIKMRIPAYGVCIILSFSIVFSIFTRAIAHSYGVSPHIIQVETQFRLDGLALGVLLALIDRKYPRFFLLLQSHRAIVGAISLGCFTSLAFLSIDQRAAFGYSLATIGSGCAILSVHRSTSSVFTGTISKILAWMGLYSYSMYIWHNAIGNKISPAIAIRVGITNPDVVTLFKYALSITFAYLISKSVEQPMMRIRDRLFGHRPTRHDKAAV